MNKIPVNRQIFEFLRTIGLCILFFLLGFGVYHWTINPEEKLIAQVYQRVKNDSLFNQQTDEELSFAGIRGMLAAINDPYAELIEPEAAVNFTKTFSGQTGVVGLYAENLQGQVVVSIVFPGGAAEEAGVRVGDVILEIDGIPLDSSTDSSETGLMLRGSPDTVVQLKILREGEKLDFELVRKVRVYVSQRMLPEGIGYISLTAYNQTATQQFKDALNVLLDERPVGLIWDLRNNEGGDMQAAQDILSLFIEDGTLFSAELTNQRKVQFVAKGNALAAEIPLVVLMDHTTYSAAETSAACIAERGRGKTIGSTSYGKGVIQATIPLQNKAMLQMTIAKWYSPNGEWFHERGVPAQIEVVDDPDTEVDEVLNTAIETLAP